MLLNAVALLDGQAREDVRGRVERIERVDAAGIISRPFVVQITVAVGADAARAVEGKEALGRLAGEKSAAVAGMFGLHR